MKILIIEDEKAIAEAIEEMLKKEKYDVRICNNGEEGGYEALTGIYDLIILDIMIPRKNGFEILKELREEKIKTPVIMLTAKSEMEDKLRGLENGADDYITKPFHMRELIARIKVILKRNTNIEDINNIQYGNLSLNLNTGEIKTQNNKISINGKELKLLEILLINKNQIVSRETITDKIWGFDTDAEYNNVEVYISFLRRKLKLLNSNVHIKTVRGLGYKLEIRS